MGSISTDSFWGFHSSDHPCGHVACSFSLHAVDKYTANLSACRVPLWDPYPFVGSISTESIRGIHEYSIHLWDPLVQNPILGSNSTESFREIHILSWDPLVQNPSGGSIDVSLGIAIRVLCWDNLFLS